MAFQPETALAQGRGLSLSSGWFSGLGSALHRDRTELLLAAGFFLLSLFIYPFNTSRLNPALYRGTLPGVTDNWLFDADNYAVPVNMADRWSPQMLNRRHPLFSVLTVPPVYAVAIVARIPRLEAARVFFGAVVSCWAPLLFLVLSCLLEDRLAAVAFTLAGMASAASIYWFAIIERHGFEAVVLALSLFLLAAGLRSRKWQPVFCGAAFFLSLGMTLTNAAIALLYGVRLLPFRTWVRTFYHGFAALAIVCTAASVYIPNSAFLGLVTIDQTYTHKPTPGSVAGAARSMFLFDYVAPRYSVVNDPALYPTPVLSFQNSRAFSTGLAGTLAAVSWLGMLAMGAAALWMLRKDPMWGFVFPFYLLFQFLLHNIYGKETFLYAANSSTVLLVVCAAAAKTRLRWPAIVLAICFAGAAWWNNTQQFQALAQYTWTLGGN